MLNERAAADVHDDAPVAWPRPSVTAAVRFVTLRFTARVRRAYILPFRAGTPATGARLKPDNPTHRPRAAG